MNKVDFERLRKDLQNDALGAFFVGEYGGAIMQMSDVEKSSPERLVSIAECQGVDLSKYKNDS